MLYNKGIAKCWKTEDVITEVKDGGYGYHSVWINLPRFIRKTARELAQ